MLIPLVHIVFTAFITLGCTFVQALLSLGASPDYKDRRGLTPLYHTVLTGGETSCCETLLYHHAKLGIRDENGWDETHQVRAQIICLDARGAFRGSIHLCRRRHACTGNYIVSFVLEAPEEETFL